MTLTTTGPRAAADRLIAAAAAPLQCEPVRDILGDTDIASAYAVQQILTEDSLARGRGIVGHKIGLTSPAVQRQLGVDQPDSGVLFADMQVASGTTVATDTLLQPKVEAEIAFILAEDLHGDLQATIPVSPSSGRDTSSGSTREQSWSRSAGASLSVVRRT